MTRPMQRAGLFSPPSCRRAKHRMRRRGRRQAERPLFCGAGIRSYLLPSKKGAERSLVFCRADGIKQTTRAAKRMRPEQNAVGTTLKSAERRHEGATADTSCFFSAQGHLKLFIAWQKRWEIRGGVPAGRRNTGCNRKKNAVVTSEQTEVKLFC